MSDEMVRAFLRILLLLCFLTGFVLSRGCGQRESEARIESIQRALDAYGIHDPEGER